MLIIPFDRKIDWRHPPLITFFIIALNVIIYFAFQSDDDHYMGQSIEYYFESGLSRLELPRYQNYRQPRATTSPPVSAEQAERERNPELLFAMLYDKDFMQQLRADKVVQADDDDYVIWKQQRAEFERQQNRVTSQRFGLRSGQIEPVNLLTHFFLHGSIGHLFGNMLFLFAVGFIVEATLGSGIFLLCYWLLGFASTSLNILLEPDSIIPSIGASGAIAGLMGLYAVLFGRKQVSFFYFIFVYFDYIKAPAFLLLLAWIGYELYQQIALADVSNVNYLAHLSGLCSGALLGLMIKRFTRLANVDYIEKKDRESDYQAKFEQAQDSMAELDFNKAKPLLKALQRQAPTDRQVLYMLYRIYQSAPASPEYHDICLQILELTDRQPATERLVADTVRHYLVNAQPKPELIPQQIETLTSRLLGTAYLDQAEQLVKIMLRNPAHFAELPLVLSQLAHAFKQRQQLEKAQHYLHLLKTEYPDSAAARF